MRYRAILAILGLSAVLGAPVIEEDTTLLWSYQYEAGSYKEFVLDDETGERIKNPQPDYNDENNDGKISVSVFKTNDGEIVYKQIPDTVYSEMGKRGGVSFNPKHKVRKNILEEVVLPQFANAATAEFVNITNASINSGTSLTFSHTTSGGNEYLIVYLFGFRDASGITFDGTALTEILDVTGGDGSAPTRVWNLVAPGAKTANIVVTYTGNAESRVSALTYKNTPQTSPVDATNSGSSIAREGSSSLSLTTGVDDTIVLFSANSIALGISSMTGTDVRLNGFNTNGYYRGITDTARPTAGGNTYTVNHTSGTSERTMTLVSIKYEAAAAASGGFGDFYIFD